MSQDPIKTHTRYIIERETSSGTWSPWAFPVTQNRINALGVLEWCREKHPGASFRLIFETREHIATE